MVEWSILKAPKKTRHLKLKLR